MEFIFFVSSILIFALSPTASQSINTNTTDFSCSNSICKTYIIYRTQSPDFLDLGHVSDLFGVSRLSIIKSNNLPSEDITFLPNQLIFIPILCSCSNNHSSYNTAYYMKQGDSFYFVSISAYENLTDYQAVEDLNPSLEPSKLKVGQEVMFPIYCKCPSKTQLDQGINFLVTYVWQLGDNISLLSKKMNTSADALVIANNYRNFSAAIALPILIPMSTVNPHHSSLYYTADLSPVKENHKSGRVLIIISSLLGSILAFIGLCFLFVTYLKGYSKCMIRMSFNLETKDVLGPNNTFSTDQSLSPRIVAVDKLLTGVTEYIDKQIVFETKTILEATMNLNKRYRLGTAIYRAIINGEVFAVKQSKGDVTNEVNILRIVNHANLVKLIGVSDENEGSYFLVYEFAENGSLDKWLYPKATLPSTSLDHFLSWKQRLMIALDVANGLQYMHEHTRPSIVHRDIRTKNILLNSNFKAKISNFSLASPASTSETPTIDVFGFGIILLELLSGRRAMETKEDGRISMLWKEIRVVLHVQEKTQVKLKQWMDPILKDSYSIDGALCLASMARACTLEDAEERPKISEIVFSLSVLAHSCSTEFEKASNSHSGENFENICPPLAR